jgi:HAD superfamily hydrolase (TIGR01459 family)
MAETAEHPAPPIIDGVAAIADRYDGFILDLWGVMHDGVRAYPGARDCLAALHRRGKRIVILSNAPRRAAQVVVRNAELGIPAELYHGLVTSGEAAWQALHARSDPWHRGLGRHAYCLMPVRDRGLLDGLGLHEAGSIAEAGFILNTGVESARERIEDFEPVLAEGVAAGLPMLCANPDLVVIRGGVRELCAGSLAARYETLGGFVHYHGKPHEPIYRLCFEQLGVADRRRVLAVGDSLHTDVAGAARAGIDVLFIAGGIHADELGLAPGEAPSVARLARLCREGRERPTWAARAFAW